MSNNKKKVNLRDYNVLTRKPHCMINRLNTSQEKISEFEDIVIETRMSCRFIPVNALS